MWMLSVLLWIALLLGNTAALTIRLNFGSAEKDVEEAKNALLDASRGIVVDAASEVLRNSLIDAATSLPSVWENEETE